jgi:hypothetical protein
MKMASETPGNDDTGLEAKGDPSRPVIGTKTKKSTIVKYTKKTKGEQ